MARTTMMFGFVLIVLGVCVFLATGHVFPTSLIPAWFGIVIMLCGAIARTDDAKKRMLWMHCAVTLGLIGFLFPGFMAAKAVFKAHSGGVPMNRNAVHEQLAMAAICLFFVMLCVRSFIKARQTGTV